MKIIFARHGESEANLLHEFSNRDWKHPLTEKGRLQAEMLAQRLRRLGVTRIYTSPLMRAVQTAEIAGRLLGLPFEMDDALREYDVGVYEGTSAGEGWQVYNAVDDAWLAGDEQACMPGGESLAGMRGRFKPFLDRLLANYAGSDEVILLVGHGGLYRLMLPECLLNVSPEFARTHGLHNTGYVLAELQPAGLVCLSWRSDQEDLRPPALRAA